jgi:hypothetical protein
MGIVSDDVTNSVEFLDYRYIYFAIPTFFNLLAKRVGIVK